MELKVQITGTFEAILGQELAAGERAVSTAVAAAGAGIKQDWRAQILASGLGSRLANSIRHDLYPKHKPSLNAAGMVYTNAPKIIGAFERGAIVRGKSGNFLAIPTEAAGVAVRGQGRITPAEWQRRRGMTLRFVARPGRPALLVADGRQNKRGLGVVSKSKTGLGRATVPIFVLIPQAKLPKKLNLFAGVQAAASRIPGLIGRGWK